MQIVHMQPLVSSLSASDRLVQPLRKDWLVESIKLVIIKKLHTLCSVSIDYRNSVLNHLVKCTVRRKQLKCIIPVHGVHFLFRG